MIAEATFPASHSWIGVSQRQFDSNRSFNSEMSYFLSSSSPFFSSFPLDTDEDPTVDRSLLSGCDAVEWSRDQGTSL
jgi:hypothetical protein